MIACLLLVSAVFGAGSGMVPKICSMQTRDTCSGPSTELESICIWNGEDGICTQVEAGSNQDDICKQWARDQPRCQASPMCFWDSEDMECTDVTEAETFVPGMLPAGTGTADTSSGTNGEANAGSMTGSTGATGTSSGSNTATNSGTSSGTTSGTNAGNTGTTGGTASTSGTYRVSWGVNSATLSGYESQLRSSMSGLIGVPESDMSVSFSGSGDNTIVQYDFPASTSTQIRLNSAGFVQQYVNSVNSIDGLTYSAPTIPTDTSGGTDNASGTTDNTSGSADNTSGATDNTSGTADNTSRATDNTSGTADNTSGTSDNTSGTADNTSGTTDNTSGTTANTNAGTNTGTNAAPRICRLQAPQNCFGRGVSEDAAGTALCVFDPEDRICLTIEVSAPEGICQVYNYRADVNGCTASPHCYYDESDRECTENTELEVAPVGSSLVTIDAMGFPEGEFEYDHEWEREHESESEFGEYGYIYPGAGTLKSASPTEQNTSDYAPFYYGLAGFFSSTIISLGLYYAYFHRNQKPTFEDVYQDIALDHDFEYSSRDHNVEV